MGTVALIVAVTKLAGIVMTLSVAANVFSFSRYRRKTLRPFRSPIDESAEVLAAFNVNPVSGKITKLDRDRAWGELQRAIREKKMHPFYRDVNKNGCMYAGGLDEPIYRPYIARDWRFGHYQMDGLQDPLSRLWRSITAPIARKKKKAHVFEEGDLVLQTI